MSAVAQFLLLAAIEVAGLFAIWFLIRARVRRYLEIDELLGGVREEARSLVLELNETADRNVSLVEDRMAALRELLGEADRRILVATRESAARQNEREVYAKLNKRRPIVPEEPITLSLGTEGRGTEESRQSPEVSTPERGVVPGPTKREEALELYRRGFSADLIAARTGATVAEIELLVEMEERRSRGQGSEF